MTTETAAPRAAGGNKFPRRNRQQLSPRQPKAVPAAAAGVQSRSFSSTPVNPATSTTRFSEIPGLNADLLKAIPYEFCTDVQAATLPVILANNDVLAQAKTGTGKTLGFLVPAIQHMLAAPYPTQGKISIFVLSPTRELAQQIAKEASGILEKLGANKYTVQTVVGGTNINTDVKSLQGKRVDILVATPGRVIDLLENGPLRQNLSQLKTLVLDEADRLLDQGFRRDLVKIIEALPSPAQSPRQTLLFSATIPSEVHSIASLALKANHKFVSTLSEEDQNVHEHVKQELVVVPLEESLPATYAAIKREQAKSPADFKVIVFLPTARSAGLFYSVFDEIKSFPCFEIHSRMSQSKREKSTEQFRQVSNGVLFSSDVTARGIDIKGVTAVIQAGAPSNAEQYIHRLGRTARAGAEGHGVLILSPFEQFFLQDKTIRDLTLHAIPAGTSAEMAEARDKVNQAMDRIPEDAKSQAYGAWLGYYKAFLKSMKWSSADLVQTANAFARDVLRYGPEPPGMLAKTIGKMGLKGTPGLRIVKELEGQAGKAQQGGRGQQGRGGQASRENGFGQEPRGFDSAMRGGGFGRGGGGGGGRGGGAGRGGSSGRGAAGGGRGRGGARGGRGGFGSA